MIKPEILAPSGSFDCLQSAVNAGADAIYLGGSMFGARAFAENFKGEELLRAIDYAHIHNKKIYLTVNTLLKNNEIEALYDYLLAPYKEGLDAVIVQDFGVLKYIKDTFSNLPIHCSTQMTITSPYGANMLKHLGASRVVPARELCLKEIEEIKKENLEVEVFVHGALCYSYSGQCLLSSIIGGRSGNRGRCAQPCRLNYQLFKDNKKINNDNSKYILSPKDLCSIDNIPELILAGIDSFKIEGRMKKPEYVAATVSAYKNAVESYFNGDKIDKNLKNSLLEIYNRGGFTNGYFSMANGKEMMSCERPNHQGILVGKIENIQGNKIFFTALNKIDVKDILEIVVSNEKSIELTSNINANINHKVTLNGNNLKLLKKGMKIYKTKSQKLIDELNQNIITKNTLEKIDGHIFIHEGQPWSIEIKNNVISNTVYGEIVQSASNSPISKEQVLEKVNKLGNTEFIFHNLTIDLCGNCFLNMKEINNLRRLAIDEFRDKIISKQKRNISEQLVSKALENNKSIIQNNSTNKNSNNNLEISVNLTNAEYLELLLKYKEIKRIYVEINDFTLDAAINIAHKITKAGKEAFLILPNIFRTNAIKEINTFYDGLNKHFNGYLIKNNDQVSYFRNKISSVSKIILDYSVYNYNNLSIEQYKEILGENIDFTLPVELRYEDLRKLNIKAGEMIVYGHLPVMVSAQCVNKNFITCNKENNILKIKDRLGNDFYCKNICKYCYNIIYNGKPLSLLNCKKEIDKLDLSLIRLNFTNESVNKMQEIINKFIEVFCYNKECFQEPDDFTKGHFKRGVD